MRESTQGDLRRRIAAFAVWGFFPLYFLPLVAFSSLQIIAHRIVWSCFSCSPAWRCAASCKRSAAALADRRIVLRLALLGDLHQYNWLAYVWAVMHGHVVDASLGYFINPLVNVLLGVVVSRERLDRAQWIAVRSRQAASRISRP